MVTSNTVSYDRAISPKNPIGIFWTSERESANNSTAGSAIIKTELFGIQGNLPN